MSNKNNQKAVIAVAKKESIDFSKPVQLSTGYFAMVRPVSISLITDVQSAIKDPQVPMWMNEQKQREEENPNHPDYLRALEEAEIERNIAATDAMVMFGVELVNEDGSEFVVDGDGKWLKQLQFLSKRNQVNLDGYDLSDELELEFVFKKYVAVATPDIEMLTSTSVSKEDIDTARSNFRDN